MSWQLASYLILGLVLFAGFVWYERSHPSSKVLALVATLAALAALGRVAFAPLPNVKPTTDIVFLSGFALGGAPGFAVGAIAALASNLVFGQGPWTPWQMGAWGLIGVLGAVAGTATGRQMGRLPLALCCLAVGFVYGAILDFSTLVTFTGDGALDEYLAISATSLPFNVAHAAGNFVFCMAFGPAFVRALLRFRSRFEISWRPLPAGAAAAALLAALVVGGAPSPEPAVAASGPASYLVRSQNSDGGWGPAPGARSSSLYTATAVMGIVAGGRRPARSANGFLARAGARTRDIGELERSILGIVAGGGNPRRAAGTDLVRKLTRRQYANGSFNGQVLHSAFAIFALRAASRAAPSRAARRAARFIARQQNADGGFGFLRKGTVSGVDETGAAVQALVAGGRSRRSKAVRRAVRFIARRQNPDGGFPLTRGGGSNAQSASWAVQGFVAAGRNPSRVRRNGSRSAMAYLRSLVGGNGAVRYSRTSRQTPVWVTGQALQALARRPLPIRPRQGR